MNLVLLAAFGLAPACAGDPGDKTGTSSPTGSPTDTDPTDTDPTDTDPTDTDPTDTDTVTDTDPTDTDTDTVTDTDTDTTDTVTTLPTGLYGTAPGTPLGLPSFSGVIDMSGAVASNTDLVGQPTVMWFYPAAFSGG